MAGFLTWDGAGVDAVDVGDGSGAGIPRDVGASTGGEADDDAAGEGAIPDEELEQPHSTEIVAPSSPMPETPQENTKRQTHCYVRVACLCLVG